MSKIDLAKFNIRTDLIIEDNKISHNEKNIDGLTITTSMKDGNYVTLSFDDVTDKDNYNKVKKYFTEIIKDILKLNNISDDASCLIIGLGNILSTPDSLGVKSLDNIV